jgi:peptide/nickel transport system substrate-binding protein
VNGSRGPRPRGAGAVLLGLSLSLLAVPSGCGPGSAPDPGTLTILYPGDERVLGPYWEMPAKFLMFLPLVGFDEEGETVGVLARSWEHSADYRRWIVHLRTNVRWHDGVPFTAHDVAFTYRLWADADVLWLSPGAARVTVVDDSTFTLDLRRPRSSLSEWHVYYPKHLLEGLDPAGFWEWEFWARPVGNGPYRYLRHVPRTLIELEANPVHFRGRPGIDRIALRFGGRQITELLAGRVDVMDHVDHGLIPKLRADPRFEVHHQLWPDAPWVDAIYWNHRDSVLGDPRIRRALTLAVDRAELRALLEVPAELPIVDVLYTGRQFRSGELPAPLPYDPEGAVRLLEAAGWRDTDGDGVRDRAGRQLRFTVMVGPGGWGEPGHTAAVYLQEAFRRVGVRMELETVEAAAIRERLRAGRFQAVLERFFVPWVADESRRERWWGADGPTGWYHPRAEALFDSLAALADPGEIDAVYRALVPIFQEELPILLLFPRVQNVVAHRRVGGLQGPFRADPVLVAEELRLDGRP